MAEVIDSIEHGVGSVLHHDDEDEGDCCRICRCGATEDNSLFYPCKCSGSIKYVHQQCLIDWLAHSGNTHCEVCKHMFSFTPVYAKDTPSRLPWHELAVGLLKRAAAGFKVAHRVWLVSCVWLIAVPWVTCLAWRLAFLRSFAQVPRLLMERCNVLAVATDCIQGSLLSISIVFLNIAVSSLKEHLKTAITKLEQQLLREAVPAPPPAAAAVAPAAAEVAMAGAEAVEEPTAAAAGVPAVGGPDHQQFAAQANQQQQQAAVAAELVVDPAVAAAVAEVDFAAGDDGVDIVANDGNGDDDGWGDVPFEELLGLQGPWLNFIETIVLVILGNAFFMAGVVYLPLNIGRLLLTTARRVFSVMTAEQQMLLQQTLSAYIQIPYATEAIRFVLSMLAPLAAEGTSGSVVLNTTSAAIAAAAVQGAASAVSNSTGIAGNNMTAMASNVTADAAFAPVSDITQQLHMDLLPSFDSIVRELHAQLELPARADFVALSLGHCLLGALLLVGLWLYVSLRLWRAARTRLRRMGRRPLVEVVGSTGRWLLSAASLVGQGLKLLLLLSLELGAFPLAAGLWLDICALPLTSASLGQRGLLLSKAPFMTGCMHWVLGIGCLLLFTFLVCAVREVLRPGALPFLKDPTNPERNPIRELLDEPLVTHLGRVIQTWVGYAGLCVVIVHLPALLARALVPSLYPLRLALFDPLTQIPADMLLLHILIPFTVEHVRVKRAVKAAVKVWLQWAGRLLGWEGYLLPAADAARPAPAAPAAAAPVAAVAAEQVAADASIAPGEQQQQVDTPGEQQQGTSSSQLLQESSVPEAGTSAAAAAAGGGGGGDGVIERSTEQQSDTTSSKEQQQQHQHQQEQQQQQQQQPVEWYQQQPRYKLKVLCLFLFWLTSMMIMNLLMITLPVGLGRSLFHLLGLPFKNDLFTGAIGLITIWGSYSLAAGVATSANVRGVKAVLAAAWKWLLLTGQCGLLMMLWLGVVATMTGMLCELILLPLRLPPNQTALIYLYQDWTMGVLALKLFHLLVMIAPRREGRQPPDPDSWQAHFEAIQAAGLRNLDFHRALFKIVLPVLIHLGTSLAAPYVVTKGLLPLLGLPAVVLQYADLYSYLVYHGVVVMYLGIRRAHQLAVQLHNAIRDDKYLVGRQLNNFELQQQQKQQLQEQLQQQEQQQLVQGQSLAEGLSAAGGSSQREEQQHQQQHQHQQVAQDVS